MKTIAIFIAMIAATLMAGCQTTQTEQLTPKIGMANPASKFCVQQGGKLEIRDEVNGQVGYCQLPDGVVVEEWELFRHHQNICKPEEAKKLVGMHNLDDQQILNKTKAIIIRRVGPNDLVTMDYRNDRITVTVDDQNKIIRSSCG